MVGGLFLILLLLLTLWLVASFECKATNKSVAGGADQEGGPAAAAAKAAAANAEPRFIKRRVEARRLADLENVKKRAALKAAQKEADERARREGKAVPDCEKVKK